MKRTPWIVVRYPDLCFRCLRCGDSARLELPAALSVWIAAGKAFRRAHRDCRVPS